MRVIAVTNQKGGSGKTTTAVNLAAALGEKGRKVLVIDLDPQASATTWLGIQSAESGAFSLFVENGNLSDVANQTDVVGVDVVPASMNLADMEKILAREIGPELILRERVAGLPAKRYDYVLMDCPPALGVLTVNALTAAREVLVPVEAHVMALAGLAQLEYTVQLVKQRLNPELAITGIVACRVDNRTRHSQDVLEGLRERFGNVVYNVHIRENVRIAEAPSFGQPITLYDSKSAGASDYRALADEVIAQEKRRK